MATYRLVRRRGPIEVPTPAPSAPPPPERNLWVGEPHVWIDYGPPGAQCSRCGADRQDSGGMACIPRDRAPVQYSNATFVTDTGTYRQDTLGNLRSVHTGDLAGVTADGQIEPYRGEPRREIPPPPIAGVVISTSFVARPPEPPRVPKTLLEQLEEDEED